MWLYSSLRPRRTKLPGCLCSAVLLAGAALWLGCGEVISKQPDASVSPPDDTTPPRVISTVPDNGAAEVPVDGEIEVTFSEELDPATISVSTFVLRGPDGPIPATVFYDNGTARLVPSTRLPGGTFLTATLSTVVSDQAGNQMTVEYSWTFTTGYGTTDVNAVLEYTIRDIPLDGKPDVFVGGNPPSVFTDIKPGTEDRAVVELDLASVPRPFESVTLEFELTTLDPDGTNARIEVYVFDANGVPDLGDFFPTTLFAEFWGPNDTQIMELSYPATGFVQDAMQRNVSHIGFMFRATGSTDRYRLTNSSVSPERAARLRVVH